MAIILEDMLNFHSGPDGLERPFGEYDETPFSYALAIKPAGVTAQTVERFRTWLRTETAADLFIPIKGKVLEEKKDIKLCNTLWITKQILDKLTLRTGN